MTEALAKYENSSPASMMLAAIDKGADLDKLEKLMQLQERWDANEARKAYHEAMSKFKANPPEIEKDKTVSFGQGKTSYNHATLANVTKKIGSALSEFGLSAAWKTDQKENLVTVTCTITHKFGHSESTSLTAAPDTSGSKNAIQAIGSTVSYLERYTILALTGLATHEMDDDALAAGSKGPSPYEKWEIKAQEGIDAAKKPEDIIPWWPANKAAVLKDLKEAEAAKIRAMVVNRKKELEKAAEREPGSEG